MDIGKKILYVIGDATSDETLKKAGILQADGIMAALPEDKDNLFITVAARQLKPDLRIVSSAIARS